MRAHPFRCLIALLATALLTGCAGTGPTETTGERPWQTPVDEAGNGILLLSDFEMSEEMWVGIDNSVEIPPAKAQANPAAYFNMGDFHPEYDGDWYPLAEGHAFVGEQVRSGDTTMKWHQTTSSTRIMTASIPQDWTDYGYLSVWMYSEEANFAGIELVCYSEDHDSPDDDYFKKEVIVDWEGWRLVEVPFDGFTPTRKPVGWHKIDYIKIASTGWGHVAQVETVLHFDQLRLTTQSVLGELLAQIEIPFDRTPRPYLFANAEELGAIREKVAIHSWAANAYTALSLKARELAGQELAVPDTGGGFYHNDADAAAYAITEEHYRLSRGARDLALVYHLEGRSGDALRYGRRAVDILLAYAEKYPDYELHDKYGRSGPKATTGGKATAQAINEAKWVIPLAWAYDLVHELMSPDERELVETQVFRQAAEAIVVNNEGRHNHQAWYNAGVGVIGFLLKEADYVRYAVYGADNGFLFQMRSSITRDGMWYEGSGHYQFYTMEPLLALAEAAWHGGINLYENDALRRYFLFPVLYQNPAGELPVINDGRRVIITEDERARFLEIGFARYGDPRLAAILLRSGRASLESLIYGSSKVTRIAVLPPKSALLDDSLAVLRSTQGELYATVNGLPYGGGHSHYDKLSMTFFGADRILAPDSGSIKYRDSMHEGYFKQTIAHNTLRVDGMSQNYVARAEPRQFTGGPAVQFVRMVDDEAYPGVEMDRSVLLTNTYALDLFKASSEQPHRYEWLYRNYGRLKAGVTLAEGKGTGQGDEFLEDIRMAELSGDHILSWNLYGGLGFDLHILADGRTGLMAAKAPVAALKGDEVDPNRYDMIALSRQSAVTLFASVLAPSGPAGPPTVRRGSVGGGDPSLTGAVEITAGGTTDLILYNRGGFADLESSGLTTDGTAVLVGRRSGVLTDLFASQASYVELPEGRLLLGPGTPGIRQPDTLIHLQFGQGSIRLHQGKMGRQLVAVEGFFSGVPSARTASGEPLSTVDASPGRIRIIADEGVTLLAE